MDSIYRLLILFITFIMVIMIITVWLWWKNPYYIATWWNRYIKRECDKQDKLSLNGIPSYCNAYEGSNKTISELHQLIQLNHDSILKEVLESISSYEDISNVNVDLKFQHLLKNELAWKPIWVRFMGDWGGSSNRLPTLKKIASLFPEVATLYVSILKPGTSIVEQKSLFRPLQRYHYGLKIPENDIGLKIAGYDIKWKEGEGYVWDDTIRHSAWNHTTEPRIVIFADVFRDLSSVNLLGSKLVYNILKRTPEINHTKVYLQEEAIQV